jgi:hypothetical protein
MSDELFAISKIPPAPAAQGDYDSICAALMHTERGRWFLQEYARRNRSADTQLLLAAIQRIEAVVCAERNKQAQQGFRSDLLEMAKAITRTRAEVAEIKADASHAESARPETRTPPPPKTRDVFAAAERIRDVTWAMRGHGFDPSTCDQLEELAGTILSASSLRDPTDHRASKLSEVLQYLERRIDTLLESSQDGDAAAPEPAPALDPAAFGPEPAADARPTNGFAGSLVSAEPELTAGDVEASPAAPPSPPNSFYDVAPPLAADAGLESEPEAEAEVETEVGADTETEATASSPAAELKIAPQAVVAPEPQSENSLALESKPPAAVFADPEFGHTPPPEAGAPATDAGPPPPTSEAAEGPPEPLIATQDQEVEAQAASETASTAEVVADTEPAVAAGVEPSAAVAPSPDDFPAEAEAPAAVGESAGESEAPWSPSIEDGSAAPPDTLLPRLELSDVSLLPLARPQTPARSFLPQINLRAEPAAASEAPLLAAGAPMPPDAAMPQPSGDDPLAAVKALSQDELIALFS